MTSVAEAKLKARSGWLPIAAALVAAMTFATSVWVAPWWRIGEVTIGPFGSHHCFGGACRSAGLSWTGGSDLWMRGAIATGAAGLIAMMLLLCVAAAFAARRLPVLVAKMTLVALVSAIACGAYFVVAFPGLTGASLGLGALLYVAAAILGTAAPIIALRRAG